MAFPPRMIQLNLRLRIAAAIAVVCLAIIMVLGVTLYIASEKMEFALVEQLLSEELDFLIQRHEADPGRVPAPDPNKQYYTVQIPGQIAQLPAYLHKLTPGHYDMDIAENKGERDILVRDVNDTRYIVVYDIGPYEVREREFKQLVSLSLFIAALLALLTGYFLAGYLTRQLSLLGQRVIALVPDQPNPPLFNDKQDIEIAMLAKMLDQYQTRILGMIKREQEFTSNVSHELRTPITAIRTSCELLAKDPSLSEKSRERVGHISHAIDEMTHHTDALLFVAREQEFRNQEPVALLECVNDAVSLLRDDLHSKRLAFEVAITPDIIIETNRQALQIVLINLIRNAINYTDHGFIRVSHVPGKLIISDSGMGISADQLSHIFDRNYRGDTNVAGSGLGLNIVKRICDQIGWGIQVDSILASGSRFVLTLS